MVTVIIVCHQMLVKFSNCHWKVMVPPKPSPHLVYCLVPLLPQCELMAVHRWDKKLNPQFLVYHLLTTPLWWRRHVGIKEAWIGGIGVPFTFQCQIKTFDHTQRIDSKKIVFILRNYHSRAIHISKLPWTDNGTLEKASTLLKNLIKYSVHHLDRYMLHKYHDWKLLSQSNQLTPKKKRKMTCGKCTIKWKIGTSTKT